MAGYQRDGAEAMKTDDDTDWYYIDDGDMLITLMTADATRTTDLMVIGAMYMSKKVKDKR
ncbi:MAG: hypothetical protein ACLTS6_07790 [Anaerobutyricum sp.]